MLKTQSTARPTRKMWAVILSGALVGALDASLRATYPGTDFSVIVSELSPLVYPVVMALAGYLTRDRA